MMKIRMPATPATAYTAIIVVEIPPPSELAPSPEVLSMGGGGDGVLGGGMGGVNVTGASKTSMPLMFSAVERAVVSALAAPTRPVAAALLSICVATRLALFPTSVAPRLRADAFEYPRCPASTLVSIDGAARLSLPARARVTLNERAVAESERPRRVVLASTTVQSRPDRTQ